MGEIDYYAECPYSDLDEELWQREQDDDERRRPRKRERYDVWPARGGGVPVSSLTNEHLAYIINMIETRWQPSDRAERWRAALHAELALRLGSEPAARTVARERSTLWRGFLAGWKACKAADDSESWRTPVPQYLREAYEEWRRRERAATKQKKKAKR